MRVPKGLTVKQLLQRAGVRLAEPSILPLSMRASDRERAEARESLRRRCPYLFTKRKPGESR